MSCSYSASSADAGGFMFRSSVLLAIAELPSTCYYNRLRRVPPSLFWRIGNGRVKSTPSYSKSPNSRDKLLNRRHFRTIAEPQAEVNRSKFLGPPRAEIRVKFAALCERQPRRRVRIVYQSAF